MRVLPCLLSLCPFVSTALADGVPYAAPAPHPGIHARQLQHWNSEPARDWQHVGPRAPKVWPQRPGVSTQTHVILGFHPYWMGSSYLAYDWSTLHTVVFFSLELDATGGTSDAHAWPWTALVQHAHAQGARILLAATQFSSGDLTTLLGNATYRSAAVATLVNAMLAGEADGLCLDFEAIPGSRKQQYVDFAEELRNAMQTSLPQSQLVITTPAVDWNNAYDYDELAARSDYLLLMAYDYHWSGSSTSGPVAPLDGWGTYNVLWSIADHLTWGAPADKLLLGVPYYGYRWNTTNDLPGATTTASGTALTYGAVQSQIPLQQELWDSTSQTPWLRTQNPGWQQTWFDDAASLMAKYQTVQSAGLAGVGIWALGYDDPYTELWNTLHDAFDQTTSSVPGPAPAAPRSVLRLRSANPFRQQVELSMQVPTTTSGSIEAAATQQVAVVDVRGRLVCLLEPQSISGERISYSWDGRTQSGRAASPGVYLASPVGSMDAVRLIKRR